MPIKIRPADSRDIHWLCGQLKNFANFYGTHYNLFPDEDSAANTLSVIINDHYVRMAYEEKEKSNKRVGFIAGIRTTHFLNPKIQLLSELFWWVDEKYRYSRAGLLLLNDFIEYGKKECHWVQFTLEHHSPVKDETLIKKGFKLQEKSFLMEIT